MAPCTDSTVKFRMGDFMIRFTRLIAAALVVVTAAAASADNAPPTAAQREAAHQLRVMADKLSDRGLLNFRKLERQMLGRDLYFATLPISLRRVSYEFMALRLQLDEGFGIAACAVQKQTDKWSVVYRDQRCDGTIDTVVERTAGSAETPLPLPSEEEGVLLYRVFAIMLLATDDAYASDSDDFADAFYLPLRDGFQQDLVEETAEGQATIVNLLSQATTWSGNIVNLSVSLPDWVMTFRARQNMTDCEIKIKRRDQQQPHWYRDRNCNGTFEEYGRDGDRYGKLPTGGAVMDGLMAARIGVLSSFSLAFSAFATMDFMPEVKW